MFICLLLSSKEAHLREKKQPTYKDADVYTMRFRQCMTRSLTLIKMHVANAFRNALADIKDKDINVSYLKLTDYL